MIKEFCFLVLIYVIIFFSVYIMFYCGGSLGWGLGEVYFISEYYSSCVIL